MNDQLTRAKQTIASLRILCGEDDVEGTYLISYADLQWLIDRVERYETLLQRVAKIAHNRVHEGSAVLNMELIEKLIENGLKP